MLGLSLVSYGQLDIKGKLERKVKHRADKHTDRGIDKGLDKVEEGVVDAFKNKDSEESEEEGNEETEATENTNRSNKTASESSSNEVSSASNSTPDESKDEVKGSPVLNWSKYDFVPGEKVIFEDNQENEENGEFPSRWDLARGTAENADFGGDNVIMFRQGGTTIVPYLKNSDKDYLPDVFTIEFDLYYGNGTFNIFLYDKKNQKAPCNNSNNVELWPNSMTLYPAGSKIPNNGTIKNKWAHVAIAYTNGKVKGYIDDTRLVNIPHLDCDPSGIALYAYHASDQNRYYIKNFRLAEGGVKYYDRVLQDGKIVSNGIRFDVGKATLRPESMGVINQICDLMKKHPDLKFSVEGHTDSDGDADSNLKLSEARAETVMNTLIKMGISKDRLSSKGFGETMPVDANTTPEGKANNRRVEFVKI